MNSQEFADIMHKCPWGMTVDDVSDLLTKLTGEPVVILSGRSWNEDWDQMSPAARRHLTVDAIRAAFALGWRVKP